MILEGFEITNWSCIRRVAVSDLPATGVVVFHAPNGTGKSSIVAALRATLMDFAPASSSAGLKRWFRADGEAPRVTVQFRAQGMSYRLAKQFKKSGESRLEQEIAGGWQLITKTPAEVHDKTQELAGSRDSSTGLYQLLWLDQAQFALPDAKNFDTDVQASLRRVLGVMQTPRDDAFIERVTERRSTWFTARNKSGDYKPSCDLARSLKLLDDARRDVAILRVDIVHVTIGRFAYMPVGRDDATRNHVHIEISFILFLLIARLLLAWGMTRAFGRYSVPRNQL
jgi:hypothetical protein